MFGLKEHIYFDGPGRTSMGKFLRSFIPLLWIKSKGDLILKNGDEDLGCGTYYKVLCSDKMANVISKQFGFDTTFTTTGTMDGTPMDVKMKVNGKR